MTYCIIIKLNYMKKRRRRTRKKEYKIPNAGFLNVRDRQRDGILRKNHAEMRTHVFTEFLLLLVLMTDD